MPPQGIQKDMKASTKKITNGEISASMKELGVKEHENALNASKATIERRCKTLDEKYFLSKEEATLVATYTYEGEKGDETKSPYRCINKKLWQDNAEDQRTNKKSYLQLLLRTLRKLPRTKPQTLYRGVKEDKREYHVGDEIVWKGFSSTSLRMAVTRTFLKNDKTNTSCGTLFDIRGAWGYKISGFSDHVEEG